MKLTFLGAAGTVTGAKTLLDLPQNRILVDCGLFQGLKSLREENWKPLPGASTVDRVLLTHAHLDHSGYLPLLVKQGYRGKIFCTAPTRELLRVLLLDFVHLAEEEARLANRQGFTRHQPARPLYRQDDVVQALRRVQVLSVGDWHEFGPGAKVRLEENGHILGSVWAEIRAQGKTIVFSGDIGRKKPLLLRPGKPPRKADWVVMESTYGDRLHSSLPPERELQSAIEGAVARGGKVLLPTFAVGRSQDVLFLLSKLRKARAIPEIPVYLDSPMAIEVSEVSLRYWEWQQWSRSEARELFAGVRLVRTRRESEALVRRSKPAIILAGSGMATGGRILRHLEECLPDPRHGVLLAGYQAPGTRGRQLLEGSPEVKIHGRFVPVRASISQLRSLSAHADREELLAWLGSVQGKPKVFLHHGEPQASDSLRVAIQDRFGFEVSLATPGTLV